MHGILKEQSGGKHQLNLGPFEHAFAWQEDMDADEAACVLANLIFQGAVPARKQFWRSGKGGQRALPGELHLLHFRSTGTHARRGTSRGEPQLYFRREHCCKEWFEARCKEVSTWCAGPFPNAR